MKYLKIRNILHPIQAYERFVWRKHHERGTWNHLIDTNRKRALELEWRHVLHRRMNWNNPQTLNEKIQWLEAFTDTSLWSLYTDKQEVRKYVEQCGFKDILLKEYGVWEHVEDIDFDSLPNGFAIKCTHDCGSTLIIKDKSRDFDRDFVVRHLQEYVSKSYGYVSCEPHYTTIPHRIMAEELLPPQIDNGDSSQMSSTIDYKIWCIEGKAQFILVCYNRTIGKDAVKEVYTIDPWESRKDLLSEKYQDQAFLPIPKPKNLHQMISMAETLAKPFHQVRVDLYNIDGKIFFGELTFTAACGRMNSLSDKAQLMLGKLIKCPQP